VRCFVWKSILLLSCTLALTQEQSLPLFPSAPGLAQAAEPSNQSPQEGVIKTCTGQRIDLGAPQLTDADLKALTRCSSEVMPQLLEALKAQDWKVKVIAAHTLGLLGTKAQSSIPALSSLIQDENADIRFAAAQVLGEIGTEAVVPALTTALQDKDENVRVSAAVAFQKIGRIAKPAKAALIDALWDGNWYVRSRAAKTIAQLGLDANDLPQLTKDQISVKSLISLFPILEPSALNHPENLAPFLINASQHPDPRIRESAALALAEASNTRPGHIHLDVITEVLLKLLQNDNLMLRRIAAKGLSNVLYGFESKYTIEFFERKKQPSSPDIERELKQTFPYSDRRSRIKSALLQVIQDSDPGVRQAASESLHYKFDSSEVIVALLKALRDSEPKVRQSAINSLSFQQLGRFEAENNSTIPSALREQFLEEYNSELIKFLSDEDESVRQEAISRLPNDILLPALIEILKKPGEVELHRTTISALWSKGLDYGKSEEAISLLTKALQDQDFSIRQQAAIALNKVEKLSFRDAFNILLDGLNSEDASIRLDSIVGINLICSKGLKPYEAIGKCPDASSALPILVKLLKTDVKPIQYAAAFTIVKIDPNREEVISIFREIILEGTFPNQLSSNALESLAQINSPISVKTYIECPRFDDKALRHLRDCHRFSEGIFLFGLSSRSSQSEKIRNIHLSVNSLKNENMRFTAAETIANLRVEELRDHSIDRTFREELQDRQLNQAVVSQLLAMLSEAKNEYGSHLLKELFKLKNQDLRRSISYALGNQAFKRDVRVVNTLTEIVNNESEELDTRWMAATSLQNLDIHNTDWFFNEKKLLNPKSYQCRLRSGVVRFMTGFIFSRYSAECIYNYSSGCGAGLGQIYESLRNLLNRSKK
jgi:HEAT repeat protein